jgi:hypothetical protein
MEMKSVYIRRTLVQTLPVMFIKISEKVPEIEKVFRDECDLWSVGRSQFGGTGCDGRQVGIPGKSGA